MIFDQIQNCELYNGVNESFSEAFAFIRQAVAENFAVGRYEFDGKRLYAMVQEYTTKPEADCKFEGHENYIDIQYIVSGTEVMETMPISEAIVKIPYDAERDIAFYENGEKASRLVVGDDCFAIFYPHDLHRPSMAFGTPSPVKKIVVKIKI